MPIAELPDEEFQKVQQLEAQTDKIKELRGELAATVQKFRKYLNIKGSLSEFLMSVSLKTADLKTIIDSEAIESDLQKQGLSGDELEMAKMSIARKVRHGLVDAAGIYEQLSLNKGYWTAEKKKQEDFFGQSVNVPLMPTHIGADGSNTADQESQMLRRYYRMRLQETTSAKKDIKTINDEIASLRKQYDWYLKQPGMRDRQDRECMDEIQLEINQKIQQYNDLLQENPEVYYLEKVKELQRMKETFDQGGTIVETPYIKEKMEDIQELLDLGRPVFIHGELGTGKTELARYMSRKLAEPFLKRWEADNPPPSKRDREAYAAWQSKREEAAKPMVVSGHRAMEADELLGRRAIKPGEKKSPEEQIRMMRDNWPDIELDVIKNAEARGADVKEALKEAKEVYRAAMIKSFENPISTEYVLGPVIEAMKRGKPVILDEINAIPHHVLIVLNDMLTRKPGDIYTPPFPGQEPFEIPEGFAVFATGNYKPEDGKVYVGRQKIDAAFLSRFGIVHYDYLPMNVLEEAENAPPEESRKYHEENQLLQMLVARELKPDLTLEAPPGAIAKLRKLAICARIIQDVFSGNATGYYATVGGQAVEAEEIKPLNENVLSIRHLMPVIDAWFKSGFENDLDDYIFKFYIQRSSAQDKEMMFLYNLLQKVGSFFPVDQGWPKADDAADLKAFSLRKHQKEKGSEIRVPQSAVKMHSREEVVRELFGRPNPRKYVNPFVLRQEPVEKPEDINAKIERERDADRLLDLGQDHDVTFKDTAFA